MDTICATLKDYFEDYQFLKPKNFKMVIEEAQVLTNRIFIIDVLYNASDPDPSCRIQLGSWILVKIRNPNPDLNLKVCTSRIERNKLRNILLPPSTVA
jgi:hypothetical protein